MKKWHFILLFIFSCSYAQHDSISKPTGVVAADRMNVVYRGVANPISISVPDCKTFTAEAPGLTKVSEGHYTLSPGAGLIAVIKLDIIKNDGSQTIEEHCFKIKNIPRPSSLINGFEGLVTMSQEEFRKAVVSLSPVAFDVPFDVLGFSVKVEGQKTVVVKGNSMEGVTILGIFPGCQIVITDIRVNYHICGISPIIVKIFDSELYFNDKSYRKQYNKKRLRDLKDEIRRDNDNTTLRYTKAEKDSIRAVKKIRKLYFKK
ncbi:GldM family protein [Flavobacterium sp.]|uniref:GldM family protein n=1 Tax=Flavobacterium sp. TaxID=239 RepID=UPI00260F89B4|nr:GldM family protein [Flavobacterium sp.]